MLKFTASALYYISMKWGKKERERESQRERGDNFGNKQFFSRKA